MNTNLENFYQGDEISYFIENVNQYENCTLRFTNSANQFDVETTLDPNSNTFKFNTSEMNEVVDNKTIYPPYGDYAVLGVFSKVGEKRTLPVKDNVEILESVMTSKDIKKTENRIMFDILNDKIKGRLRTDYNSYTIQGRSITKMDLDQLFKWRNFYQDLVLAEESASDNKYKYNNNNVIITRFIGKRRR